MNEVQPPKGKVPHLSTPFKNDKERKRAQAMGTNERMIWDMMRACKRKGNPRDYVLIAGSRLIDWEGAYDLTSIEDGGKVGVEGVALVHKRNLGKITDPEFAAMFWRPKVGMRIPKTTRDRMMAERHERMGVTDDDSAAPEAT